MFTVDTVLEALRKFDVKAETLDEWEKQLGLRIQLDAYGRKQYSPHHINLFKNVKKHLALGRTMQEIRKIITLPPEQDARPVLIGGTETASVVTEAAPKKAYASVPGVSSVATVPVATPAPQPEVTRIRAMGSDAQLVEMVDRLSQEKDALQSKLISTERLNSHLYNANKVFHHKLREMTTLTEQLKVATKSHDNLKLLSEKSKLHKQIIDAEKSTSQLEKDLLDAHQQLQELTTKCTSLETQLWQSKQDEMRLTLQNQTLEKELTERATAFQATRRDMQTNQQTLEQLQRDLLRAHVKYQNLKKQHGDEIQKVDPALFIGDWEETGSLLEVCYDNFGIHIDTDRSRMFRIASQPERLFGRTAVIPTQYEYETNTLWKRTETMVLYLMDTHRMEGEVTTEYLIDGIPVAKAIYRITCNRHQASTTTNTHKQQQTAPINPNLAPGSSPVAAI